jgi:SAM-dependent methyltransferase
MNFQKQFTAGVDIPDHRSAHRAARQLDPRAFAAAYEKVILGNSFCEEPEYYRLYRARYRATLERLCQIGLMRPARLLEIGGGQIALLSKELFGDEAVVADVSDGHAAAVTRHGIEFRRCDLIRDDLPERGAFDAVVLCEVVEHLPVPLHLVLEKVALWLQPGGFVFLTTPNLYRLRNVVRLASGRELFCPLQYPEPGHGIGHPFEFSADNLRWQMERARLEGVVIEFIQLSMRGSSPGANLGRLAAWPLLQARRTLRDSLIAWGRLPRTRSAGASPPRVMSTLASSDSKAPIAPATPLQG